MQKFIESTTIMANSLLVNTSIQSTTVCVRKWSRLLRIAYLKPIGKPKNLSSRLKSCFQDIFFLITPRREPIGHYLFHHPTPYNCQRAILDHRSAFDHVYCFERIGTISPDQHGAFSIPRRFKLPVADRKPLLISRTDWLLAN